VLAVLEFILQELDGTADRMALELHNAAVKGDAAIHGGEQAKPALAAGRHVSNVPIPDSCAAANDMHERSDLLDHLVSAGE